MIHEMAELTIDPTNAAAFEAAVAQAVPLFQSSSACLSFTLERTIERPGHYWLVVGWESVEAHMVDFRNTTAFADWRELVGAFFVETPAVIHVERAVAGF